MTTISAATRIDMAQERVKLNKEIKPILALIKKRQDEIEARIRKVEIGEARAADTKRSVTRLEGEIEAYQAKISVKQERIREINRIIGAVSGAEANLPPKQLPYVSSHEKGALGLVPNKTYSRQEAVRAIGAHSGRSHSASETRFAAAVLKGELSHNEAKLAYWLTGTLESEQRAKQADLEMRDRNLPKQALNYPETIKHSKCGFTQKLQPGKTYTWQELIEVAKNSGHFEQENRIGLALGNMVQYGSIKKSANPQNVFFCL